MPLRVRLPSLAVITTTPTKVWINVAGTWKLATVYTKVAGVWKTTTPFIKVGGTWK